jgi:acyl-CoA synthetase (AMP-forming)/AMP-acid ligase II
MHNVAELHEAIAGLVGDRDGIVTATGRWSWAEVTDRTRRLARVLTDAGLGLRTDPGHVEPWESPHDHVALYLYNGPEYLEGMLGAWKARCAPINVNYRYVAAELAYVLRDSAARAVIVGGHFVATLA